MSAASRTYIATIDPKHRRFGDPHQSISTQRFRPVSPCVFQKKHVTKLIENIGRKLKWVIISTVSWCHSLQLLSFPMAHLEPSPHQERCPDVGCNSPVGAPRPGHSKWLHVFLRGNPWKPGRLCHVVLKFSLKSGIPGGGWRIWIDVSIPTNLRNFTREIRFPG